MRWFPRVGVENQKREREAHRKNRASDRASEGERLWREKGEIKERANELIRGIKKRKRYGVLSSRVRKEFVRST